MKVLSVGEIKERLNELKAQPKRSLGQNFLISENVIRKILESVQRLQPSSIVEVGPGLGALTEGLVGFSESFQVLELDRAFSEYWRSRGLKVLEGDALKADWQGLELFEAALVSNLPYQISSSLVIDRSIAPCGVKSMVLMFQKEVAQRILADSGKDYGLLSVIAQSFWDVSFLLEASSRDFYPAPKVASRVLVFKRKEGPAEAERFLKFVKAAFSQRRKLLVKNLEQGFPLGERKWKELLPELEIDEKVRAEDLGLAQYHQLFEAANGH